MRLKRDKETADMMLEELLHTEDSRARVALYSILSSAGVKSAELRDWREQQHDNLEQYGYDIVQNRERKLLAVVQ